MSKPDQPHMNDQNMLYRRVLIQLYRCFEMWSAHIDPACQPGCATCCTQDVWITGLEGEVIVDYLSNTGQHELLRAVLSQDLPADGLTCTTNEFARACLDGKPMETGTPTYDKTCPFLQDQLCAVYPVRPFNCRCLVSTSRCQPGSAATLPEYYLSGATALNQLIEHLAQGMLWGNLLCVLYLLLDERREPGLIIPPQDNQRITNVRNSCRTARPNPGFLLTEQDQVHVMPLLSRILATRVGGRSIEAWLDTCCSRD